MRNYPFRETLVRFVWQILWGMLRMRATRDPVLRKVRIIAGLLLLLQMMYLAPIAASAQDAGDQGQLELLVEDQNGESRDPGHVVAP